MAVVCTLQALLLWCAVLLTAARALEFLVEPTNMIVAPNSVALFKCAVRGEGAYMKWSIDGVEYGIDNHINEREYSIRWSSTVNSSLQISAVDGQNGTEVRCMAGNADDIEMSERVYLNIAAAPLAPDQVTVSYNSAERTVDLQWSAPFTHMPQFPILNYTAHVKYWGVDKTLLDTKSLQITGTETAFSFDLSEVDVCNTDSLCVALRATNSVGSSQEAESICTVIERQHELVPVNVTLSPQSEGTTLVSVLFKVPACFPQPMHSSIIVEEAHPQDRDELTDQPLLATGDALLMESHKMAVLEQDVVYCITVHLTGQSENATSQPLYVMPAPQAQDNGKEEDGGSAALIVAIVCVLLFTALLITVLFVSAIVLYLIHRNRKDSTVVNHMHPNPLYENTYYDTVSESYSNPPSYESHIYQDMPELVRRLQASGDLVPSTERPVGQTMCCQPDDVEEMKRVQCTMVGCAETFGQMGGGGAVGGEEREGEMGGRESEYVTMQSVTESTSPLQTNV